jgi:hypothetical protein
MDISALKELVERCHRLAAQADDFTKKRLLDLAARYEAEIARKEIRTSLATKFLKGMND